MVLSGAQGKKRRKRKKAGMIQPRGKRKLKRRKVSPCSDKVYTTTMMAETLEWEEDYPITTTTTYSSTMKLNV